MSFVNRVIPVFAFIKKALPWTHEQFISEEFPDWVQRILLTFDSDMDGNISITELVDNVDKWYAMRISYLDWWLKRFGGLLLLSALATIIPGRIHSFSGQFLRWPILLITYTVIIVELVIYIAVRLVIRMAEAIFTSTLNGSLRKKLSNATSYEEWLNIATKLDLSQGRDKWQNTIQDNTASSYNWDFIKELMADLRRAREENDLMMGMGILHQCTKRNVGGIMSEELFSSTNTGEPKTIVKEFFKEVEKTIYWLTDMVSSNVVEKNSDTDCAEEKNKNSDSRDENLVGNIVGWAVHTVTKTIHHNNEEEPEKSKESIPNENENENENEGDSVDLQKQVIGFLRRCKTANGRTALCLSGGAMMGCYHFGHVKGLLEKGVLPNIISGTSAGSIIAALICTRTDEEIERDLKPEILVHKTHCFSRSWPDRLKSLYKNGCAFDKDEWINLIQWFCCGDLTFEEAYRKTGRILCITLSTTTKKAPSVLVNYITAPNVTIASAVVASAAVPGLIKPVLLQIKENGVVRNQEQNKDQTYWDGSIKQDIPISGLAEQFNCQFFLVAQCNPHIVPFAYNSKGGVGRPSRWTRSLNQNSWRGGFLLAALEMFLKADMRAKFHFLNDIEVAVGFTSTLMTQVYGGTTDIIPQVSFWDYFKLITDPTVPFLKQCFQGGSVAAYQHCAMMKLNYCVDRAINDCLAMLERCESPSHLRKTTSGRFVRSGYSFNASMGCTMNINASLMEA